MDPPLELHDLDQVQLIPGRVDTQFGGVLVQPAQGR
jgi:hypothetical protein